MDDNLRISRAGALAMVTLNRPDALNALSLGLEEALREAISTLIADDTIRAIVLTGAGRAFCAGVDLKELGTGTAKVDRIWHGPDSLAGIMRASPKPLIAAVHGFAITGGLELALNCDFIIAAADAKFADTHARVGITPSWGLSQILPRRIGEARALQMSMTGSFVDAETALAWGLANEVVPRVDLLSRATALAVEIAETDRTAMTKIRTLMRDGANHSLADALVLEADVFDKHMAGITPEDVEARRAAVQERGKRIAGHMP